MHELQDLIKELEQQLTNANRAYAIGCPIMTDAEYDEIWFRLQRLDKENEHLYHTSRSMAGKFNHLNHRRPIYGLQKAFNMPDMQPFYYRFSAQAWKIEPKYDGVAAMYYKNSDGSITMVLHGDGVSGADITHHVHAINLTAIKQSSIIESCELLIRNSNWNPAFGSNPRNCTAGMINSHHIEKIGLIEAIPHNNYAKSSIIHQPKSYTLGEIQDIFLHLYEEWSQEFPMDGLVIKLLNEDSRIIAGHNKNYYHWAIAWKPPIQTKKTTVVDILWKVSRQGKLVPTVEYSEVSLCSTLNRFATGNNAKWILDQKIHRGATIVVGKAGEIIPQILKCEPFMKPTLPDECPECGAPLLYREPHLECVNDDCFPKKLKEITYFYEDKGMALKSIGPALIEKLLQDDKTSKIMIEHPYALLDPYLYDIIKDLFRIWGQAITINYLNERVHINGAKNAGHFIAGLGYKGLGYTTAMDLIQKIIYGSDCRKLSDEVEHSFILALEKFKRFAEQSDFRFAPISKMSNIKYCITGELSQSRNEFIDYLNKHNWVFVSSVSKKTDYLITNDLESASSKMKKAQSLGIKIITEDQLYQLIGKGN